MDSNVDHDDVATSLSNVKALLEDALNSVRLLHPAITETMASDVWPQELPEPGTSIFRTLYHELDKARSQVLELSERICARPRWKFLHGFLLSEEEYHALCIDGVVWPNRETLHLGALGAVTDYELYRLCHYEDDQWRGLINPAESPRVEGRIGARIGRPPEEVPRAGLRPEQSTFFAQHMPAVFSRFA